MQCEKQSDKIIVKENRLFFIDTKKQKVYEKLKLKMESRPYMEHREVPKVCDRCLQPFIENFIIKVPYLYKVDGVYKQHWICNRDECLNIEKAFGVDIEKVIEEMEYYD